MSYLARLRETEKTEKGRTPYCHNRHNPDKTGSGGSVGTPCAPFPEIEADGCGNCGGSGGSPLAPFPETEGARRAWLAVLPSGAAVSITCTPPASRADVEALHPDAVIEPDDDPAPGRLNPRDTAMIGAWLDAVGEADAVIRQEILMRAAADPETRDACLVAAVACGAAMRDAPETTEARADDAYVACIHCRHFRPNPRTPEAGFGRCRIEAPASLTTPTLWPYALHHCPDHRPLAQGTLP